MVNKSSSPRSGRQRFRRFAGSLVMLLFAYLGLAPQALCFRPLRGLIGHVVICVPGARAPGSMLSPASRARWSCCYLRTWGSRPRLYAFARFAGYLPASLIKTTSLVIAPREATRLPSFAQSNEKIRPSSKVVSCLGVPPAIGCPQMLSMPPAWSM